MIAPILIILLANRVRPAQIRATVDVNVLSEGTGANIFASQIRQIRTTTEAPLGASATGNNLNLVATSSLKNVENYQPIASIYSFDLIKNYRGNNDEQNAGVLVKAEKTKSLPLVWDNCFEYANRENQHNIFNTHKDAVNTDHYDDPHFQSYKPSNINIWSKRHINKTNASEAIKAWLEKYNTLKNGHSEEGRPPKTESVLIKRLTSTTATPITTVKLVPITRKIFEEMKDSVDETENTVSAGYTKDWFESKNRSKIRFNELAQIEYLVPTLKLEEGFHPFTFMSEFFSFIYPFDFPVGLIQDLVWGKTFPYSFLQSIKVESTFLGFIVAFTCIALVIPAYIIILSLLSLCSNASCDDETETGALYPEEDDSDCNDRAVMVMTLFVVLICCIFISGMTVCSEQAHTAATSSHNLLRCACVDVAAWLAAAARDLHHSLVPPVDMVLHAYKEDLRNVETLLGEPVQHSIAAESGIDMILDSLADIITESEDLATKISSLRDMSIRAGTLASAASDRIRELARQLDSLKKHCTMKDSPLCDTINTNSLEVLTKFDLILHEQRLLELRALGVENLTRAISSAKQEFRTLPSAIAAQTTKVRQEILRGVESHRQEIHDSARILNDIVRHLTASLHSMARQIGMSIERVQKYEFWRWSFMLACVISFGFVMILVLIALLCGCGEAKGHAKRTLQVSTIGLCLVSLILWSAVSATFLLTGHAEVYICHALWDSPQYKTLSALLDRPSPLLPDKEGVFDALFRDLENVTIDVSITDVLRDCERNQPAYIVFQLDRILDVNKETSYFEWEDLQADLTRMTSSIDVSFLKNVSAHFNKLLNEMLLVSDVDLAKYRMDYNGPIVGKDLPSLVDQLENIAAQVTDLSTAGRLETLATRIQRLHVTNVKPLEQLRGDLVYKLTEIEIQLMPFRRKLNISLSHIHTAQFYINNQGDIIAHKRISTYVSRLISHAAGWRTHVLVATGQKAARCGPLFAVYSALRALLCTQYVSSLHGWWVCGSFLGVLWCTALTPLCVKLWRGYGRKVRAQESLTLGHLGNGQQSTPTTALCDSDSNWNTPGPPPPLRNDSW